MCHSLRKVQTFRPISQALLKLFTALFALLPVVVANPISAQELVGRPHIIDGDTIRIDDTRIRLHGIDAPEAKQTCMKQDGSVYRCGDMAKFALAALIEEHWVTCRQTDKDYYGRIVAICYTGPVSLNAEMVKSGWALAYKRYSTEYVAEEIEAKQSRRGMWQGKFIAPWEWRRGNRLRSTAQSPYGAPHKITDCRIKGNISRSGKIYHEPGGRWYSATTINETKGERWFCSVEEAVRAGWRAPKN